MIRRQERQANRAMERKLADRDLLDEAMAPYLRGHGAAADPTEVLVLPAPEPVVADDDEPVVVTVRFAEGATIDLRRQPGRASVVRLRRRDVAVAG